MNNPATHLSNDEITRYCERKLPPVELLAADDHLAHCDVCYGRMGEAQGLGNKLLSASKAFNLAATDSEVTHLTYEQMAGLVDSRMDDIDREVVESHLELCRRCETELKDLRELSSAMATYPAERPTPISNARSLGEWFLSLWSLPAFRIPAQAAAALAVVVLAALLISIALRRESAGPQVRVAGLEQDDERLSWRAAATEEKPSEVAEGPDLSERPREAAETQAEMTVALSDGDGRVTLDSNGNLKGVSAGAREEQAIKNALLSGRVKLPPSVRELRGQSGTLMGDQGAGFSLLAPVAVVTESDQPVLSWSALEGAKSYTVTVYDSNQTQVAASGPLTSTQWAIPTALARGRTYIWQVRAVKDGAEVISPPPAGSRVKFKVLEQAKVAAIERASTSKSHLVMGVVYAEAGLLDKAEREFAALVAANPKSPTARRLLKSVRAARR